MAKTHLNSTVLNLNNKISINETKNESTENEIKKPKTLDLSYFIGKRHVEEDDTQNYLVFQLLNKYFKTITNTKYISLWQFKGLPGEIINPPATIDNSLIPLIDYLGHKISVRKFSETTKMSYPHEAIANIYIAYKLGASGINNSNPTLKNCLFGAVTLTKNTDVDKYGYSGYGIGFYRRSSF